MDLACFCGCPVNWHKKDGSVLNTVLFGIRQGVLPEWASLVMANDTRVPSYKVSESRYGDFG
jgi:hypothetical protein